MQDHSSQFSFKSSKIKFWKDFFLQYFSHFLTLFSIFIKIPKD